MLAGTRCCTACTSCAEPQRSWKKAQWHRSAQRPSEGPIQRLLALPVAMLATAVVPPDDAHAAIEPAVGSDLAP